MTLKNVLLKKIDSPPNNTGHWDPKEYSILNEAANEFPYQFDLFNVDPLDNQLPEEKSIPQKETPMNNDTDPKVYANARYSEAEIKAMSVEERHNICTKCSKSKNLYGLIDFYTYFFKHGGMETNEYYVPAMSYLYIRGGMISELEKILNQYSVFVMQLSPESRNITDTLMRIAIDYPQLSTNQMDFLESLLNNPKYCVVLDDILFDREKLPRAIFGITKNELEKTYDNFSNNLLQRTFNCMILNTKAQIAKDDEYTEYYVYERRNNEIIRKQYRHVGTGEFVISGTIDTKSLSEFISENFNESCSAYFLNEILKIKPWYRDIEKLTKLDRFYLDWYEVLDIAKNYFANDISKITMIKEYLALHFLQKVNKKQSVW